MYLSVHYLRGLAAVAIIIDHASPRGALSPILAGGVDVFFVISGFVMVVAAHGRPFSRQAFLARRALRIYPLWWVSMIAFVLVAGHDPSGLILALSAALIPVLDLGSGLPAYSPALGVGWTLMFEVAFYILFATANGRVRVVVPALILLGFLNTLFIEFAAGCLLARWVLSGGRLHWIALPVGVALLFLIGYGNPVVAGGLRGMERFIPATLIVAGCIAAVTRPTSPPLRLLGDASYSLYLTHMTALIALNAYHAPGWLWLVTTPACVGFGLIVYLAMERPILNYGRSRIHQSVG